MYLIISFVQKNETLFMRVCVLVMRFWEVQVPSLTSDHEVIQSHFTEVNLDPVSPPAVDRWSFG